MKTKADLEARIVELTRQVNVLHPQNVKMRAALNALVIDYDANAKGYMAPELRAVTLERLINDARVALKSA